MLLALAMEDMINETQDETFRKTNGKGNSSSTATYGNKEEAGKTSNIIERNDFERILVSRRLNGAMQLA